MCLVKRASMLDSFIGLLSVSQWLVLVELVSVGGVSIFAYSRQFNFFNY